MDAKCPQQQTEKVHFAYHINSADDAGAGGACSFRLKHPVYLVQSDA